MLGRVNEDVTEAERNIVLSATVAGGRKTGPGKPIATFAQDELIYRFLSRELGEEEAADWAKRRKVHKIYESRSAYLSKVEGGYVL